MVSYAGRNVLLKIADDDVPPSFSTLGAARTTVFDVNNDVAEVTALGASHAASYSGEAGMSNARITLQGIFRDSEAEKRLRTIAMSAKNHRFMMVFPNGDTYEADFVIESYRREGSHDGLEMFHAVLIRSGAGTWASM